MHKIPHRTLNPVRCSKFHCLLPQFQFADLLRLKYTINMNDIQPSWVRSARTLIPTAWHRSQTLEPLKTLLGPGAWRHQKDDKKGEP